ncbi:cytochrome c family protein [Limimaricola sp. G21655-S1]|uniref:c-type cytochrome n=1 Tax=unclassified Limimaricola TaxID=2626459 RepID=UPI0022AFD666|nr:cytochrome c family protein [Limimaricola sp. G21655-S1]MCZ4259583.1 cytochrome c family protein [Limimaricola sp. G21655-S1]
MERDMFDTMTLTKVVGGLCGTLLVFLLGGWAADIIYGGGHGGGHGEVEQAYSIPVEESGDGGAAEEEAVPFEEIYASADAAAGEGVWRNCRSCHALEDGVNGTGPSLHAVVGREVGAYPGYDYSGALKAVADVWSPENLDGFLANPRDYAPGTKMTYNGLKDAEDRANLIAYLATIGS